MISFPSFCRLQVQIKKKILQIQMQLQKYVQLIVEKQYGGYEVLISANRGALWSLFHH